jgi:cysteine desulfurase/selenocysteine lyase
VVEADESTYDDAPMALDLSAIRREFATLHTNVSGAPVVYLDSAATALTPDSVWEDMRAFEKNARSNVHRGMHVLAERATDAYEAARDTVRTFVGAKHSQEIIFTKNTTEAINLVAHTFGETLEAGDTVLVSELEHHSAIVPWQQLAERKGIVVEWIGTDDNGNVRMDEYEQFLETRRVRLVMITAQSNVLGSRPPLKSMIQKAHTAGAVVLVDAAQFAAHHQVDVQAMDCDFLVFSGHKVYGPTGVGVLFGKRKLLEDMPPFLGGGSMIRTVTKEGFTPADIPQKFEAGTPPITQVIGLASAINWQAQFSWEEREAHERELLAHARKGLATIEGLTLLGTADASGCVSFTVDGVHPHDLTDVIGKQGICLRAGHHCAQPLHARLGVPATARLSVGIYNTTEDIDRCRERITNAVNLLRK